MAEISAEELYRLALERLRDVTQERDALRAALEQIVNWQDARRAGSWVHWERLWAAIHDADTLLRS